MSMRQVVEDEGLLTAAEVAEIFRMTEQALATWRYRKRGPKYLKIHNGKNGVRYRREDIDAYLEQALVDPREPRTSRKRRVA